MLASQSDELVELDDELEGAGDDVFVSVFVAVDELDPESDELSELLESGLALLEVSFVEPAGVVDEVLPRLSFLKKPLPLNVTPTGWKTFFTASTSPESG